jgi:predicted RNA-binding protein with PIN domain
VPAIVIVDGNNVIGARPDGWWRDRRGAAERLLARLVRYAAATGADVTLVLDGPDDLAPAGRDGVQVVVARRRGRDAADDRIRELLADADLPAIEVVTSDRALAADAATAGASVVGAGAFLARLDDAGC